LGISYKSKSWSCYGVAGSNRIFTFLTDREFAFEDACGQNWHHAFHRLLSDFITTWVDIDIFKRGEEE
jgi:hypothetical protein